MPKIIRSLGMPWACHSSLLALHMIRNCSTVIAFNAFFNLPLRIFAALPILVWGSLYWFGDSQTKTGIPD